MYFLEEYSLSWRGYHVSYQTAVLGTSSICCQNSYRYVAPATCALFGQRSNGHTEKQLRS